MLRPSVLISSPSRRPPLNHYPYLPAQSLAATVCLLNPPPPTIQKTTEKRKGRWIEKRSGLLNNVRLLEDLMYRKTLLDL